MKEITFERLLKLFDESTHADLRRLAKRPDVSHLVVFENRQLDSSRAGDRTAVIIGPGCSYKTLDAVRGLHLHDLPSQRQYPASYVVLDNQAKARVAA